MTTLTGMESSTQMNSTIESGSTSGDEPPRRLKSNISILDEIGCFRCDCNQCLSSSLLVYSNDTLASALVDDMSPVTMDTVDTAQSVSYASFIGTHQSVNKLNVFAICTTNERDDSIINTSLAEATSKKDIHAMMKILNRSPTCGYKDVLTSICLLLDAKRFSSVFKILFLFPQYSQKLATFVERECTRTPANASMAIAARYVQLYQQKIMMGVPFKDILQADQFENRIPAIHLPINSLDYSNASMTAQRFLNSLRS